MAIFTKFSRIVKFLDFSPSSFKLKRGILPPLIKHVSKLENYLSYQTKIFLVNLTPKELTPCKIFGICRCALKVDKNANPVKKHFSVNTNILYNVIFNHQIFMNVWYSNSRNYITINTNLIPYPEYLHLPILVFLVKVTAPNKQFCSVG